MDVESRDSPRISAHPARPLVSRISVVYLYVRDLQRSLRFYRDLLGLPMESDAQDADWAEAHLPGGYRFALHEIGPSSATPQTPGSIVVDFETDDFDAAVERLRAAGVRLGRVMHERWGSVCEVFDPDGYRIGLFKPAR
jgi:lactoylglutathione lyase